MTGPHRASDLRLSPHGTAVNFFRAVVAAESKDNSEIATPLHPAAGASFETFQVSLHDTKQ
jgi:hypothetical protein